MIRIEALQEHGFSNGYYDDPEEHISVVVAGNPLGLTSAHHEKLLLVDPECPKHATAFIGVPYELYTLIINLFEGFDMTHGRLDTPHHTLSGLAEVRLVTHTLLVLSKFTAQKIS